MSAPCYLSIVMMGAPWNDSRSTLAFACDNLWLLITANGMGQTTGLAKRRPVSDWQLIALGVDESMSRALTKLCACESGIRFAGVTSSVTTLLFALEASRPELVVIDERALGSEELSTLANLHRASPHTRMLIIGDALDAAGRWEVIQLGVAGHLNRAGARGLLARAIAAIRRGEFWLSRSQSSELLTRFTADEIRQHDTVRELAVLTRQENRVLQQCLMGQSNKEIARALGITEQTVKIHLQHIFQKLGVRRRADLLLRRWVDTGRSAEIRRPIR